MTKAIAYAEHGGKPNLKDPVKGQSGEMASVYQYTPETWVSVAAKYLGDSKAELNLENETKASYLRIKDWLDKGFKPAQIASMWNAGEGEPDAWTGFFRNGNTSIGINSHGIKFNVPVYVKRVQKFAIALSGTKITAKDQDAIEEEYRQRMDEIELARTQLTEEEEAAKLKNNLLQSLINAPLTLLARTVQLGLLTGSRLWGDEEFKKAMEKTVYEEPLDLGPLGIIAAQKMGTDGYKQITGNALETAVWLVPGAKLASGMRIKAADWFGRGFAFGAGDVLREGGSTEDAIKQGGITGTFSLGLGFGSAIIVRNVVNKAIPQFVKFQKWMIRKIIVTPSFEKAIKKEGGKILDRKDYSKFIVSSSILGEAKEGIVSSAKSAIKDAFTGKPNLSMPNLAIGGAIVAGLYKTVSGPVMVAGGISVLALRKFLQTPQGQVALLRITYKSAETLTKLSPAMQSRVSQIFIITTVNDFFEELINSLKKEEQTLL